MAQTATTAAVLAVLAQRGCLLPTAAAAFGGRVKLINPHFYCLLLLTTCCLWGPPDLFGQPKEAYRGNLDELKGKQYMTLVVAKVGVVNANEPERGIVEAALQGKSNGGRRLGPAHFAIARSLDKYAKKTKLLSGVRRISDADYVVFFNLLEYRRILDTNYPYGELYVVVKTPPGQKPPGRIVWQTTKIKYAGDAVEDLLKALKTIHGKS